MANDLILPSECAAVPAMLYTSTPPASFVGATVSDDDCCSICLEPFSCRDPRTVAECTHGYHLQCILEWSQRSKECPICCRQLALKYSDGQELLAAVEFERNATSRHIVPKAPAVYEANNLVDVDAPLIDDSDFQERILQHPSGVTNRACSGNSRRRQISSRVGQAQVVPSFPVGASSNMHQVTQTPVNEFGNGLPASGISSTSSSGFSSVANVKPSAVVCRGCSVAIGKPSPENSQKLSPSEFLDLPESIKSKLFAASPRYKESFSKNTQGFKQKLRANNSSAVKELGREVEREMNVSIAGLAKMVERLDLSSKKGGVSVSGPLYS